MSDDYGTARGDELAELIDIESHAFVLPPVDCAAWLDRSGADNLRVLRRDGRVVDPLLPRNAGRVWLRVGDGVAEVEPGGPGRVRLEVGALAALYAGFLDLHALAQLGRVEGRPADLAAAAAVFAGPAPWMREMF